ncbi:MAG: DUF4239 domain-containing protein [bacterium]|nr:DUF4239 domain-containing protein [bacterium]
MAITYYMLQIPPWVFFISIVAFGATVGILVTFLVPKYAKVKVLRAHNEVTGFLFLAIASFYSLLLSFIVLIVWNQFNDVRSNVSKEGSSAMGLYRDIKYYPDTLEGKQLMRVYLDFVFQVVDEEFPNMEHMKPSRKTPEAFSRVFFKMEHLNPKNSFNGQLVAEMFNHLNELDRYRGLRSTSIHAEIAPHLWLPILLGGLITLICAAFLDLEHRPMHLLLNAMLGAFIGMFLFIIVSLDHPFSGEQGIKPNAYKEIFTLEQWAKEPVLDLTQSN